ncbi:MAG TPA: DUF1269 domain-containing protein [Gammaproteobacteria bacterium]|nr:DUF1269 domain-containing protein [Gammaproteobacteria bacterium]
MTMRARKRRLYFILPDVPTARQAVNELLLARIEERHMHALGREDLDLDDLPQADIFQRSDVVHGAELGMVVGGATGALAGLAAAWLQPEGFAAGGGFILGIALVGSLVGTWASGMIATSVPNTRLRSFNTELEAGHVLLMVDVPEERKDEIRALVKKHHPEAGDHGADPRIPAFP